MENQVQNQNITTPAVPATDNMQAYVQKRRKTRNRVIVGTLVAVIACVLGFFAYKNPQMFRASLTEGTSTALTESLYIPNYSGGAGAEGEIAIKANTAISEFDSITFKLTYSPVNALIFDSNPIVFDTTTEFESAAFQMATEAEEGSLVVTIILNDAITIAAPTCTDDPDCFPTLFKLATQINPELATGAEITLGTQNVALLNGVEELSINEIATGTITVESLDELKVLNAETIDSTHIAVHFSDYLSNVSNNTAYEIKTTDATPVILAISNPVQSGTEYGFDQHTVVLTTATQTAAKEYIVKVKTPTSPATPVAGNTQGAVKSGFEGAIFYGYGVAGTTLSDFGIESAAVPTNSYNQVVVTFTDPVATGSATTTDFTLTNVTSSGPIVITDATTSGNQVTLTVNGYLLKKNTYLLSVNTPADIQRSGDGAPLGINKVAFTGYKNGPRIISANLTQVTDPTTQYNLQVNFDENIETASGFTFYGHLYETGVTPVAGHLIDNSSTDFSTAISGTTMTVTDLEGDILNDPAKNFTFSVSAVSNITNTTGVPTDETYKTMTFWGYGHDVNANKVGAVTATKKNIVELAPATGTTALSFGTVEASDVSVFYYDTTNTIVSENISSVAVAGGNLKITLANPLKPNKHYILRITDGTNTIVAKEFVVNQTLAVTSAEATAANKVMVGFSENLDEGSVQATDFVLDASPAVAVSTAVIQSDFQHVLLTTASNLTASTIYTVNAANAPLTNGLIYAYSGANALSKSVGVFSGYGATSAQSTVHLASATATSGTNVRLVFSGAVSDTTVTPVNIDIVKIAAPTNLKLTITGITKVNSTTFDLTTTKQDAGTNYFVIMKGVKDASSLLLGNAEVLNFFGYELAAATVATVTPSTLTNDVEHSVVLGGQNLDTIETVKVGVDEMTITNQTATSITFTVPAGRPAGSYNITLINEEDETKLLSNALLVTVPTTPLQVVSSQSQAIPLNVPNDGTTTTKLWVLVTDPVGLASVSSVVVNLSQIGGSSTQAMTKDTGTQPLYGQWYTYTTTVPTTVATSATPYLLPVQAKKGSDTFNGTVSIKVTNNVYASVAPVINQAYVTPLTVPPNGTTPVKVFAKVTDEDGADTISSVVADLGTLGVGFVDLAPIGEGTTDTVTELTTRYYQSEEFTVPTTTAIGAYTISVSASDSTGEEATSSITLNVSTAATGPNISSTKSYLGPQKSVPNDEETEFGLHVYVTDPDGIADVSNVTASFGDLGLDPVTLIKDPNAAETAKSAWFSATGLTVPSTASFGVHDIEVIASDTQGAESNLILHLDVTYQDVYGDAPIIIQDNSYTTPAVAVNDGETPITLYAFVRDDNDDIESVVVNLSQIGQVGPEAGTGLTETGTAAAPASPDAGGGSCPTGSNVIVCMNPSVKEGDEGQWFILPGVTISSLTAPSSEPYMVQIVATDETGKTTYGELPISVNDGAAFTNDNSPPKLVLGVATSATTVEVLFSEEISATTVSSDGAEFTITDKDDINSKLNIIGATINASGTVVTLSTENQVVSKQYVVSASNKIKDAVGIPLVAGASNRAYFTGFKALNKVPVVDYVTAIDSTTVEIEFQDNIKPTSLSVAPVTGEQLDIGSGNYNVQIFNEAGTEQLSVAGVSFGNKANVLVVKTAPQQNGQKYRMQIKGITSFDGKKSDAGLSKTFKGYNMTAVQHQAAANLADFNGDGKVDFNDFTVFSSVYGTVYYGAGSEDTSTSETGGQPLTPDPDALVPITSEPAGGETPEE